MERYFILMIAVTLAGVTVWKKNAPGANFKNIRQKSGKIIAALAVRENGISDFPLCNKSFDLSYAGHDL